jgi:hypothetical protein
VADPVQVLLSPRGLALFLQCQHLFIASSHRLYFYGVYAPGHLTIVYPSQLLIIIFGGHPLGIPPSQ